ncbi:MAG: class 1 fructose-bisphosphatase [Acidobacteria bacterium]|nr:MAG: class 1 fructose-bisphosphatase [Acidobacteriota bacterium]
MPKTVEKILEEVKQGQIVTLEQFIISRQQEFPYAQGELSSLLRDISLACKVINREVNKAGLVDILGVHGSENVHGETVKKLDVYAHHELIKTLAMGDHCSIICSEESDNVIPVPESKGRYIVLFDPLDGSSNIDVNVSIGTIFSIYRRDTKTQDQEVCQAETLQQGIKQVAAGYVLYGSSTMMVYTTGHGVNGFTLDPSIGEFLLSHPNMTIPESGKTYSANLGQVEYFMPEVQKYVKHLMVDDPETGRPYNLRYIGTMVADIHRTLLSGGIFFYPATTKNPNGKLRLMYECNPMAFLIEQAGGRASTGRERILDLQPDHIHMRCPFFGGSHKDVQDIERFFKKYGEKK